MIFSGYSRAERPGQQGLGEPLIGLSRDEEDCHTETKPCRFMLLDLMRETAVEEVVKYGSLQCASMLGLCTALLDLPSMCNSTSQTCGPSCSKRFCLG